MSPRHGESRSTPRRSLLQILCSFHHRVQGTGRPGLLFAFGFPSWPFYWGGVSILTRSAACHMADTCVYKDTEAQVNQVAHNSASCEPEFAPSPVLPQTHAFRAVTGRFKVPQLLTSHFLSFDVLICSVKAPAVPALQHRADGVRQRPQRAAAAASPEQVLRPSIGPRGRQSDGPRACGCVRRLGKRDFADALK